MEKPVRRKTFKSGDGVAVRLPKAWGVAPGETFEVTQSGDRLYLRRIPTPPNQPAGQDEAGMTKAFDKIAAGLREAIDFAQGKATGARVHQVEVPKCDVARSVGVAKPTKPRSS